MRRSVLGHLLRGGGTKNGRMLSRQGGVVQFDLKVQLYKLRLEQLFGKALLMVQNTTLTMIPRVKQFNAGFWEVNTFIERL